MNFEHLIKRVERKKNEWSDIERIEMTQSALLHLRNCLNSLYLEHYIIAHAFRWTNSTFHVPVPDFAATSHEEIFKFAGADIIERFPEHFPDWNGHLIEGDIFPYYGLES